MVPPPERVVDKLLDELNIRDPKDLQLLEEIAYTRGAIVLDKDLGGMEARLTTVGTRAIIAVSTRIRNRQRRRFSIAHELGHLEIHPYVTSFSLCTQEDINEGEAGRQSTVREHEANIFASALLMPRRFFASRCQCTDPSLDLVGQLAIEFDTSLTATGLRYTQLCDEPVALVFSQDGRIRWFKGSREFEELNFFISIGGRLDSATTARLHFQSGNAPIRQRRVPTSAWIEPGKHKDGSIIEQSWSILSQQAVLTLLWIDDDVTQDTYYDWE